MRFFSFFASRGVLLNVKHAANGLKNIMTDHHQNKSLFFFFIKKEEDI